MKGLETISEEKNTTEIVSDTKKTVTIMTMTSSSAVAVSTAKKVGSSGGSTEENENTATAATVLVLGTEKKKNGTTKLTTRPVVTVHRPVVGGGLATATSGKGKKTSFNVSKTNGTSNSFATVPAATASAGMKNPPPSASLLLTTSTLASTDNKNNDHNSSSLKSMTSNGGHPYTIEMSRRPLKKRLTPPAPRNLFGPPLNNSPQPILTPNREGLRMMQGFSASDDNQDIESASSSLLLLSSSSRVHREPPGLDRRASGVAAPLSSASGKSVSSAESTSNDPWYAQMLADPLVQTPQSLAPYMAASNLSERRTVSMKASFPAPPAGLLRRTSTTTSFSQLTPVHDLAGNLKALRRTKTGMVELGECTPRPKVTAAKRKMVETETKGSSKSSSMQPDDKYSMWLARLAETSTPTTTERPGACLGAGSSRTPVPPSVKWSRINQYILDDPFSLPNDANGERDRLTLKSSIRNTPLLLPGYNHSNMTLNFTPILKRKKRGKAMKEPRIKAELPPDETVKESEATTEKEKTASADGGAKKKMTIKIKIPPSLRGKVQSKVQNPICGDPMVLKMPHLFFDVPTTDRQCKCGGTKCLKLYCECFHRGMFCNPSICHCTQCKNTEKFNSTNQPQGPRVAAILALLSKKPRAFSGGRNANTTGCRCKKSG